LPSGLRPHKTTEQDAGQAEFKVSELRGSGFIGFRCQVSGVSRKLRKDDRGQKAMEHAQLKEFRIRKAEVASATVPTFNQPERSVSIFNPEPLNPEPLNLI
jgi:hypothetical protein